MSAERLATVLVAPHITEKTALAMQNANQYAFRVRRDANKTEIKQAVELMFDVKVAGVQVVERAGQGSPLRQPHRPHPGLEEGLRPSGRGPGDRLRSPGDEEARTDAWHSSS